MKDIFPFIVADIGGTQARFGLVPAPGSEAGKLEVCHQQIYQCREFAHFHNLLDSYLASLAELKPVGGSIAIAGPVQNGQVRMTNLGWTVSTEEVKKRFGFNHFGCINDFGALAYATLSLEEKNLHVIKEGSADADSNRAIVGPGTGLGVAALIKSGTGWMPVSGEGGHMTFAPTSNIEMEVRRIIEPGDVHISAEKFISGPGLVNLYRALTTIHGKPFVDLSPNDVSARAITGTDDVCKEALQMFCQMLGSFAGNVCLVYGAFGAVYLGGGILPKIENPEILGLVASGFRRKGRLEPVLEKVPLYMIKGAYAALRGLAHWHHDQCSG